jgi:hypothetical protein
MKALSVGSLMALCLALPAGAYAAQEISPDPVPAIWKVQEIRYSYFGFTTAYSCDAAERKLKGILDALGAHPASKVTTSGCTQNRPSSNFFVTITAATPFPKSDVPPQTSNEAARAELVQRLGVKSDFGTEEFPAIRKTVDISRDKKLRLEPGDCELLDGVRDNVLPKLSVKIEMDGVRCTPKQVGITTPELKVSALVRLPDADTGSASARQE